MLADGRKSLERAATMRDNLTPREAMTVETDADARFGPVPQLLDRWQRLSEMYPDLLSARLGYAQDGWMMANRFDEMLPHARAATAQQNPNYARAFYLQGILLLGMERYADANARVRSVPQGRIQGRRRHVRLHLRSAGARTRERRGSIRPRAGGPSSSRASRTDWSIDFAMAVDRGEWTARAGASCSEAMPLRKKSRI